MVEPSDFSKLDPALFAEYEQNDPMARRVFRVLDKLPTLFTVRYITRLADTLLFVGDTLDLYGSATDQIVNRRMRGARQLLVSYVRTTAPKELGDRFVKDLQIQFEQKVAQYPQWLLNQGLVMLCTALDVFFEHVLEVILTQRPTRLLDCCRLRV